MVKVKEKNVNSKASELLLRRKAIHTTNKAAQRYECDVDYRLLHECVSDIFALCLEAEYKQEQLAATNEVDPGDAALLSHDILSYIKESIRIGWLCDVDNTLSASLALGLLLLQLSDEPWKGKVTLIKSQDWTTDFGKVFDVILEEVVNENLKPDKMVKKVLALTTYKHFLTGSNFNFWGEIKMSPFVLLVSATTFTSPKLSFFL
ncbi:hypothetical protein ACFX16_036429 [Malus domestica]